MSRAYYSEHDPQKAAWLREVIKAGLAAPGDVDERSIADVQPSELVGYTQCHFFAGIGVWSYALRLAGWPDDQGVWTGSCPCPSFSCAGKGKGFDDPRHLWPEWYRLIRERRPGVVFGEQVNAAIGHGWLDVVCGDMEAEGYAIASAVLGAHSAGAPHIRQRLYFCADTTNSRCNYAGEYGSGRTLLPARFEQCGSVVGRTNAGCERGERRFAVRPERPDSTPRTREFSTTGIRGTASECSNSNGRDSSDGDLQRRGEQRLLAQDRGIGEPCNTGRDGSSPGIPEQAPREERLSAISQYASDRGCTRGFWSGCDWWYGRDGKWRPIEPGIQPLAHGASFRVVKLRGYGDAIVAESAQAFIQAYCEARGIELEAAQ